MPSIVTATAEPVRRLAALGQEHRRRVRHLDHALAAHLEHADLVGRPEAVLGAAQQAVGVEALALQVEHRVDHVLEHLRAGDRALLGDVADQEDRLMPLLLASCISAARTRAAG